MSVVFKDSSYAKEGAFPKFLTQTDEKEITVDYILSKLNTKYNLKDYKKFTFTDIGAGEGRLTLPIMKYLKKNTSLESYCIEPSSLIDTLKEKCGYKGIHYIQKGMEDISLPKSDFILIAHTIQYLKDRKEFAKSLKTALNKNGRVLFVGTHPESDDLKFKKELNPKVNSEESKKPRENIFEYLERDGFKITREYLKSTIDLSNTKKMNNIGKGVISFYYHKPFSEISEEEVRNFQKLSKTFAPEGKLTKLLQFIWVE
jgi:ubiquinone/menaquinone biosynthesis C-methylase UbiE